MIIRRQLLMHFLFWFGLRLTVRPIIYLLTASCAQREWRKNRLFVIARPNQAKPTNGTRNRDEAWTISGRCG